MSGNARPHHQPADDKEHVHPSTTDIEASGPPLQGMVGYDRERRDGAQVLDGLESGRLARALRRGHSIDGITRSGGLCPSIQVRMLMMTFSPISIRPSIVAELMCGRQTTLGNLSSLGFTVGSCS